MTGSACLDTPNLQPPRTLRKRGAGCPLAAAANAPVPGRPLKRQRPAEDTAGQQPARPPQPQPQPGAAGTAGMQQPAHPMIPVHGRRCEHACRAAASCPPALPSPAAPCSGDSACGSDGHAASTGGCCEEEVSSVAGATAGAACRAPRPQGGPTATLAKDARPTPELTGALTSILLAAQRQTAACGRSPAEPEVLLALPAGPLSPGMPLFQLCGLLTSLSFPLSHACMGQSLGAWAEALAALEGSRPGAAAESSSSSAAGRGARFPTS